MSLQKTSRCLLEETVFFTPETCRKSSAASASTTQLLSVSAALLWDLTQTYFNITLNIFSKILKLINLRKKRLENKNYLPAVTMELIQSLKLSRLSYNLGSFF